MRQLLRQSVLKHLAAISVAAGVGLADPAAGLGQIPADLVAEVVDEVADLDWRSDDRVRLLSLLGRDPRAAVRVRVAESAGVLWRDAPVQAERILLALAADPVGRVRVGAGDGLAMLLRAATPIERLDVTSRWVLSARADERAAIARALGHATPVLFAELALEALAEDPVPEVRRQAIQAVASRMVDRPGTYRAIALRHVSDPDRHVRRCARKMLVPISEA